MIMACLKPESEVTEPSLEPTSSDVVLTYINFFSSTLLSLIVMPITQYSKILFTSHTLVILFFKLC